MIKLLRRTPLAKCAGTVQHNYITQKVVNEGVSEELHAEKIVSKLEVRKFVCHHA